MGRLIVEVGVARSDSSWNDMLIDGFTGLALGGVFDPIPGYDSECSVLASHAEHALPLSQPPPAFSEPEPRTTA